MKRVSLVVGMVLVAACAETTVTKPPVSDPVEEAGPKRPAQVSVSAEPPASPSAPTASVAPRPAPVVVEHAPEDLAEDDVADFLLDEKGVYVAGKTTIRLIPKNGGKAKVLAAGLAEPGGLATDGSRLYWANRGTVRAKFADGSIMAIPKEGGTATLVTRVPGATSVVVDDSMIYWMANSYSGVGAIGSCPKSLCKATILQGEIVQPSAFVADATTLYWVSRERVMKMGKSGGSSTQLVQLPAPTLPGNVIEGTAIDASHIYFAGPDAIQRVAKTGGPIEQVAPDTQTAGAIAVDAANIYWVEAGTDRVFTTPKTGGKPASLTPVGFEGFTRSAVVRLDASNVYASIFRASFGRGPTSLFRVQK